MTKITVSQTYTLHFREPHGSFDSSGIIPLTVPLPDDYLVADVEIDCANHKIHITINDINVSENFCSTVSGQKELRGLSENIQKEIMGILSKLNLVHKKALSLIKYHLRFPNLSDTRSSVDLAEWSYDGNKQILPTQLILEIGHSKVREPISSITQVMLQASLDTNVEPLLAMQYLHRAIITSEPNYRWIDATIAAELAVKEVLVRKHPSLKIVLEELPSPPLTKLYGSIMREYLGVESPYKKIFEEGVRIRNSLIHRPSFDKIDEKQASEYVSKVEMSILHLLTLLYPDDALVISYYKDIVSNLENPRIKSGIEFHMNQ
jgi:hypothetical protein